MAMMLLAVVGLFFGKRQEQAEVGLENDLSLPQILTIPFWVMLGVEAVDATVALVGGVIARLRRSVSERRLGTLIVLALLARPIISFALILNDGGWWGSTCWCPCCSPRGRSR